MHNTEASQYSQNDVQAPLQGSPDILQSNRDLFDDHPSGNGNEPGVVRQHIASFFDVWKHWTTKGRASRSEYWFGVLQLILLEVIILFTLISHRSLIIDNPFLTPSSAVILSLTLLFVPYIPFWIWTCCRLNDVGGKERISHAMLFFILLVFPQSVIGLCVRPSEPRPNEHGPMPNVAP